MLPTALRPVARWTLSSMMLLLSVEPTWISLSFAKVVFPKIRTSVVLSGIEIPFTPSMWKFFLMAVCQQLSNPSRRLRLASAVYSIQLFYPDIIRGDQHTDALSSRRTTPFKRGISIVGHCCKAGLSSVSNAIRPVPVNCSFARYTV